jgi:hypothetical protein
MTTLALDPSTPAAKITGFLGSSPETTVSNAFSPPAGSEIVVCAGAYDSYFGTTTAPSITDSVGLTWTRIALEQPTTHYGQIVAWRASCPSAETNMTVSVTFTARSGGQYIVNIMVAPLVFTGVGTGVTGAIISGFVTGASLSESITPQAVGSAIIELICAAGTTMTVTGAGTGCYARTSSATYCMGWVGTASGPTLTVSTSPENITATATGTTPKLNYIGFEVLGPAPTSPTVATEKGVSYGSSVEVLTAVVNPKGAATTAVFEYGTTGGYGNKSASVSVPAGTTPVTVEIPVATL